MSNILSAWTGEDANYFPANDQPASTPAGTPLVNLNEVVQYHLLSRRPQIEALQAIIRFDALPHVATSRQDMGVLVSHLFNSILDNPPAGTKLFIYIRCEIEKTEVMDLSLPEGFQHYSIGVYTNIVADEAWQLVQQPVLAEMQAIAAKAHGNFIHHRIVKTGCLYQLVLPGKLV